MFTAAPGIGHGRGWEFVRIRERLGLISASLPGDGGRIQIILKSKWPFLRPRSTLVTQLYRRPGKTAEHLTGQ